MDGAVRTVVVVTDEGSCGGGQKGGCGDENARDRRCREEKKEKDR